VTTGEAGIREQRANKFGSSPWADKEIRKANIWVQPINGDPARQLTNSATHPILSLLVA